MRGRRAACFVLPAGSPGWNNRVCCCRLNPLPSNYPPDLCMNIYFRVPKDNNYYAAWWMTPVNAQFFFFLLVIVIQKCICLRRCSLCDAIPSQLPSPLKSVYLTLKQASPKHLGDAFRTKPHPPFLVLGFIPNAGASQHSDSLLL